MVHPPGLRPQRSGIHSLFYYSSSKVIALHTLHLSTNEDSEADKITPSSTTCDLTLSYNAYLSLQKIDSSPKLAPQLDSSSNNSHLLSLEN
jgi:hypothetical protein